MARDLPDVEVRTSAEFKEHIRDHWAPGEHWFIVAPTGAGKTTFMHTLAGSRRFCLGFDQKGGDKTLSAFGWERMTRWPPSRQDREDMRNGKPFRRILGSTRRDMTGIDERAAFHKSVLEAVMVEGGWTCFIPDLAALAAKDMGNAWTHLVRSLILLRDSGASLVSDAQRNARIPPETADMATYLAISYTMDRDEVSDIGRQMGYSPAMIRGAVVALKELPYGWIVVSRDPRQPMILTRPEKL